MKRYVVMLPDELHKQASIEAANRGGSIKDLVVEGLNIVLGNKQSLEKLEEQSIEEIEKMIADAG